MRLVVIAALLAMSPTLAAAQSPVELASRISDVFARDGMDVRPLGGQETPGGVVFPKVRFSSPGHMRADGWFVSPGEEDLDALTVAPDHVLLPRLSFPLRFTTVDLGGGRIEGGELRPGGLLAQGVDALSFAPVVMTKENGVFVSIDSMRMAPTDGACFAIDMQGVAISVGKLLPALAPTTKDYYKGAGRMLVDCEPGRWTIRSFSLEAPDWGRLVVDGAIRFDPQRLIDVLVTGRDAMNGLYGRDLDVRQVVAAELDLMLRLADAIELGDLDARFEDAGFAGGVRTALPVIADAPGGIGLLTGMLLEKTLPKAVADRFVVGASSFLEAPGVLHLHLDAPDGASLRDLSIGAIPADSWTLEAEAR